MNLTPILSTLEGTQPKGYVTKKEHGAEWAIYDMTGCVDAGWELDEEKARRECRKAFNEVVEAGK